MIFFWVHIIPFIHTFKELKSVTISKKNIHFTLNDRCETYLQIVEYFNYFGNLLEITNECVWLVTILFYLVINVSVRTSENIQLSLKIFCALELDESNSFIRQQT